MGEGKKVVVTDRNYSIKSMLLLCRAKPVTEEVMLNVVMNVGFCCCQNVFVCECLHSLNGVLTVGGRDIIRNVFKVKIRERVRTWIL